LPRLTFGRHTTEAAVWSSSHLCQPQLFSRVIFLLFSVVFRGKVVATLAKLSSATAQRGPPHHGVENYDNKPNTLLTFYHIRFNICLKSYQYLENI
jgi:hypothetical protein